jgi:hypothetical protein
MDRGNRSIGRSIVAEVLEFNDRGEVVRGAAYYSITEQGPLY